MFKYIYIFILLNFMIASCSYALTLNESIQQTLKNSPDILITVKDNEAIKQELAQAKAAYWPKLNANLGYGLDGSRNGNTVDLGNPSPTMLKREADLTLDQMVFDGFATFNDVERNKSKVKSSTYKVIASVQDTIQKNVEVYINVLKEQELLAAVSENLAFHQRIVNMIRLRVNNGVTRKADLFQAEGRLALAKANVLSEESNLADARANYYRTVGVRPVDLMPLLPPNQRYIPRSLNSALEIAVRNNPVVRSANSDIFAAISQRNVSKGVNYPRVDVQVGIKRDRNVGGQRDPSFENFAIMRMTYTLFDGGFEVSKQKEALSQEQQAREIQQRAIRQLIESVKLTWDLYTTSKDQIPYLKSHVFESHKTVKAYEQEFIIGKRTLLDLLDSQNELFASQRALISGKYDNLQAKYRILRDMGISIAALNLQNHLQNESYREAATAIDLHPAHTLPTVPRREYASLTKIYPVTPIHAAFKTPPQRAIKYSHFTYAEKRHNVKFFHAKCKKKKIHTHKKRVLRTA